MDVLGDSYITQHIINEHIREQKDEAFRIYVTDALMAISAQDQKLTRRYADIIKEAFGKPETRTEQEVIATIREKLKAVRGEGE